MSKWRPFIMTILTLNLLMVAGLLGFVLATGRLDMQKGQAILDILRHQGTPADFRHQIAELLTPPPPTATAPATQHDLKRFQTDDGTTSALASAADRIEYARQAMEQERLHLDREAQDLRHRQELLETQRRLIESRLTQIDSERKDFAQQVKATLSKSQDQNFTRTLQLYTELKPKQVKDLFVELRNEDTICDFIKAMDPERASRIIGEFKTPEERQMISRVLEKIRAAGPAAATAAPATTTLPIPQARS